MAELTQDEETVLTLAAQGSSMIPIGRWEAPTKSLEAKGLLTRKDPVNFFVSAVGLQVYEDRDKARDKDIGRMIELQGQAAIRERLIREKMNVVTAAVQEIAVAASELTGQSVSYEAKRWCAIVTTEVAKRLS